MSDRMASSRFASSKLQDLLDDLIDAGLVSAVAALVGSEERIEWVGCRGTMSGPGSGSPGSDSLFDLASLTKPWMATLALRLHELDVTSLNLPIGDVWPGADHRIAHIPLQALLRHEAGFLPWAPLYRLCEHREQVEELLISGRQLGAPLGTYSDLGYILWGLAVERTAGKSLAELVNEHLAPLAEPGSLLASPVVDRQVVACLLDGQREVDLAAQQGLRIDLPPAPLPGQVQDGNARFMGGVAGHAGLFGSTRSLWALGRIWWPSARPRSPKGLEEARSGKGPFALGWARIGGSENRSPALSRKSLGHTGFTGGGAWLDPTAGKILVLLSHRTSVRADLDPWRQRFLALALQRPDEETDRLGSFDPRSRPIGGRREED